MYSFPYRFGVGRLYDDGRTCRNAGGGGTYENECAAPSWASSSPSQNMRSTGNFSQPAFNAAAAGFTSLRTPMVPGNGRIGARRIHQAPDCPAMPDEDETGRVNAGPVCAGDFTRSTYFRYWLRYDSTLDP